jgi:hypothetical protein
MVSVGWVRQGLLGCVLRWGQRLLRTVKGITTIQLGRSAEFSAPNADRGKNPGSSEYSCQDGGSDRDKPHGHFFKVYALDTPRDLKAGATKKELLEAMKGHVLEEGTLMGKYRR